MLCTHRLHDGSVCISCGKKSWKFTHGKNHRIYAYFLVQSVCAIRRQVGGGEGGQHARAGPKTITWCSWDWLRKVQGSGLANCGEFGADFAQHFQQFLLVFMPRAAVAR